MSLVPSPLLFNTPLEILEAIVAQSDAATLASWARVGKPLVPAVRRSLYHTVVLTRQGDIESFLEQLISLDFPCLARVSLLSSESADCSLLAPYRAIKHLDLGLLPSPEFLLWLSDAFGSSSTAMDLKLTLTGADYSQSRVGLVGFWRPRLLLAVRPASYQGPTSDAVGPNNTMPPLHLAVYLPALTALGRLPSHPNDATREDLHFRLCGRVQICAALGNRLRRIDHAFEERDTWKGHATSTLEPTQVKAWVAEQQVYFARRAEDGVVGWNSVEEMEQWHEDLVVQIKAYEDQMSPPPSELLAMIEKYKALGHLP